MPDRTSPTCPSRPALREDICSSGRAAILRRGHSTRSGFEFSGEAVPVAEQVQLQSAAAEPAIFVGSERGCSGVPVERQQQREELTRELIWNEPRGRRLESVGPAADYCRPRHLSRTGRRIGSRSSSPQTASRHLWIHDLVRRVSTRLTSAAGRESTCVPDLVSRRESVVLRFDSKGALNVKRAKAVLRRAPRRFVAAATTSRFPTDLVWGDRRHRLLHSLPAADIWIFSVADRKATAFPATPFNEGSPSLTGWTVDGLCIGGIGNGGNLRPDLPGFRRQVADLDRRRFLSEMAPDRKELYFVAPDSTLVAVEVATGSGFAAGRRNRFSARRSS